MTIDVHIIEFYDDYIHTTVTDDPDDVSDWISEIEHIHRRRLDHLIVGLDVEWRPNNRYHTNPVAILQLCVGRRCLIYQLIHTSEIPESLIDFLSDGEYTFVGCGIEHDLDKLEEGYHGFGGSEYTNAVDLGDLAAERYGRKDLENAGLKQLAMVVLDKEMEKPFSVTMSRWDYRRLTDAQVEYACIDAFMSFEIGRVLNANDY